MERLLKYWVNINRISSRWSQTLTRTQVGQKLNLRWKYNTALRFEHHASSTSNIFYLAQPQGQGHHNSVRQLLSALITYPTLSTFPVGGNRSTRKTHDFRQSVDYTLAQEDWVRVHLTGDRTQNLRGERRVVRV